MPTDSTLGLVTVLGLLTQMSWQVCLAQILFSKPGKKYALPAAIGT